jgi:hypothetical protein
MYCLSISSQPENPSTSAINLKTLFLRLKKYRLSLAEPDKNRMKRDNS